MINKIKKEIKSVMESHEVALNEFFSAASDGEKYASGYWQSRKGVIEGLRLAIRIIEGYVGEDL